MLTEVVSEVVGEFSPDFPRFMTRRPRIGAREGVESNDGEGEGEAEVDFGCWKMGGCKAMLLLSCVGCVGCVCISGIFLLTGLAPVVS